MMVRKAYMPDIELYEHPKSLKEGKESLWFTKKPDLALALIDRSLKKGYQPGIVIIDGEHLSF